jgi:hypothetical protein
MKITRDTSYDITISNPALITNLLAANGLNDCNPLPTPHIDGQDTSKTTDAELLTDKIAYQSTLGSLRFFADVTHPQLAFIIGSIGLHAHNLSTRHDTALKRVLRYLKGVQDGGLRFPHANGQMVLETYDVQVTHYSLVPNRSRSAHSPGRKPGRCCEQKKGT